MAFLEELPLDVLLVVLRDLTVEDIINLHMTCKQLRALTHARSVWHDALYLHVVSPGLPVPNMTNRYISTLSSSELEDVTRCALRLRRNWTSASPRPTRVSQLGVVPSSAHQRPRVLALYPVPGRDNRYLFSLTLLDQGARRREYSIDCWDLKSPHPSSIANFRCKDLFSTYMNADPRHPHVFCITRKMRPEFQDEEPITDGPLVTTSLNLDFTASTPAFRECVSFHSFKHCLLFDGSTFLATDNSHHVRVFNTELGILQYSLLVPLIHDDPTMTIDEYRCLKAYIIDDFVLVFRQQFIHLYHLPTIPPTTLSSAQFQALELLPVAEHKFQWRLDTLTVQPQQSHPLLSQFAGDSSPQQDLSGVPPPLCLLLRFDSWYPWPVNILHQFILPPNPNYKPRTRLAADPSSRHVQLSLPYLASSAFITAPLSPTSAPSVERADSEPQLKPYTVASLPAPLRIFTPSDAVLGTYGTALWLDAQTDSCCPAQAGDCGQRIAGKLLRFPSPPSSDQQPDMPRHAVNLEVNAEKAAPPGNNAEADTPVNVFHIQQENDTWSRLALCDEQGRIAIGCTDGRIVVYDYA
ncbi:hypothetical protein EIP86_009929 [Pleurotus ostreatoroseus]|nr:hypothetical protein EIP86_009929 [Pleurotus ostreatoroseus]